MESKKPILVTGLPRSGTSWVGRMLSQSPRVRYVHEPFSISSRPCHCGIRFEYWFQYLSGRDWPLFSSHLEHVFFPAYSGIALVNVVTEIARTRRIRPVLPYLHSYVPHRVVVKAPFALFSAETLAASFGMNVIVLIRHPAAVVNSYKSLNWTHPFSHFLCQPELMEEHLLPFRNEIEDFATNDHDIVDQISLMWKLIHHVALKFQKTNPDWIFVRHEDLALDPIVKYRTIFERVNLPFSTQLQRTIQAHQREDTRSDTTTPYGIRRDPHRVVSKWKTSLTSEEISRIRKRVDSVAAAFYSDQEWPS